MRFSTFIILLIAFVSFSTNSIAQKPENIEECNLYLDKKLKKKEIEEIKKLNENELSELHFGLGLHIRNYWLREKEFEKLKAYFHELGLRHYDDISSLIIKNYWYYLNNKKLDIDKEIARYEEFYRQAAINQKIREEKQKNVESLIKESLVELNVIQEEVPIIEIPQRELNIFCNEFIQYKNGIIINSLTTYPSNPDIGISYNYYYLDLNTKIIRKLTCAKLEIIESIIVKDDQLYISGKKNDESIILRSSNGAYERIEITCSDLTQIGTDSWIKLGFYMNSLIALQKDGIYTLKDSLWQHDFKFSLDSFNTENKLVRPIIPTENIRTVNNKIYFVQEVVQAPDNYLIEVDMENMIMVEIFNKVGMIDNLKKTVYSYFVDSENSVYLTANYIYLKSKKKSLETYIYKDKVKTIKDSDFKIMPRISIDKNGYQLLIAENGIFTIIKDSIKPILHFNNQDKRFSYYSCKFKPRAYFEIEEQKILLGGKFGGLVIIDMNSFETEWIDENKIDNSIEILSIK